VTYNRHQRSEERRCLIDPAELEERITRWEDLHTEFKDWPVQSDDLAAGLVAFANTDGDQLIIGVANDRAVTGLDDPNRIACGVDTVAFNKGEPPVTVVQEVLIVPFGQAGGGQYS
jgi:ATP-dependent DNA helicase RecG